MGIETKRSARIWVEYTGEVITGATFKVQILVAQRMAARMNGQANIDQLGANRWKLWVNLQSA
jgi:hypothetical protein